MTNKKSFLPFTSILLSSIIIFSPVYAFKVPKLELPTPVKNAYTYTKNTRIYVKQRAKFAKVILYALMRHCINQSLPQEKIERYLAYYYALISQSTEDSIKKDIENKK